jgi:hypothetical protein
MVFYPNFVQALYNVQVYLEYPEAEILTFGSSSFLVAFGVYGGIYSFFVCTEQNSW